MKILTSFLAIILATSLFCTNPQVNKNFFVIKKINSKSIGKTTFYYKDKGLSDKFLAPKDYNGHSIIELSNKNFNSIEKVKYLESQIFNIDEIQYLKNTHAMAECLVSSSGKIICVSFIFVNTDPKVSQEKLVKFADKIKEEISFEFTFIREVAQDGYLFQTFPVFR
jgi:hypothetical protein